MSYTSKIFRIIGLISALICIVFLIGGFVGNVDKTGDLVSSTVTICLKVSVISAVTAISCYVLASIIEAPRSRDPREELLEELEDRDPVGRVYDKETNEIYSVYLIEDFRGDPRKTQCVITKENNYFDICWVGRYSELIEKNIDITTDI